MLVAVLVVVELVVVVAAAVIVILVRERYVAPWKSVRSWCDGLSDRSFMVDPLSYFSFQPVLHDLCDKGRGTCHPACLMVHLK